MTSENEFEPRLGRMRKNGGAARTRRYTGRVLAAANLARGGPLLVNSSANGFSGSRMGRGAGVGRLLARRGTAGLLGSRRVVIKASIVRLAGKGAAGAAAHLRYLERDGTTRTSERGTLYGAESDAADRRAFQERTEGDRHQFRFIVSAEDGAEFEDLKPLTRRLMARAEEDLGTRLDWVAVDHFDTGHPHTHIIMRGKDDRGADLVIAREYLTTGMRRRASELLDLDLGPRSSREIEASRRAEIEQERLTSLDRALLHDADRDCIVSAAAGDASEQAIRTGRLAKLGRLGLAEPIRGGQWRLADGVEDTLRRMGERGDIIRTMQREFTRRGITRAQADQAIYDPAAGDTCPLVGRVVGRGLADEHGDRHYLIVDGIDGRSHFVGIGRGASLDTMLEGAVVRIEPLRAEVREADRTIAAVAAANGGRYDIDAHLRHDPSATQDYAEAHVQRLEAMRRLSGGATREPSGQWIISTDHLERAAAHEARMVRDRPVAIALLSSRPLAQLIDADAATWLDRDLLSTEPVVTRDTGFGTEVRDALERRRQWLVTHQFAEEVGARTSYRPDLLATLQRRELLRVAGQLSGELYLSFAEVAPGVRIDGILRRRVDLVSGRFALVEMSREFTLVPWRPALQPQIGKQVTGTVRRDGVSWSIRGRQGPIIS
ncbi:relaxase/mobilization nuclease RlxS [Sphingomonas crusticola]|uniref:relaxase/mobilization nuclease RlxS n=1 Tax=Sphingomonas crusticola TaxID=1697973 RepID=UPI000E27D4E0|nr:relaxase/mobilization nuclease RlxS [Sphingomonas crusticola]